MSEERQQSVAPQVTLPHATISAVAASALHALQGQGQAQGTRSVQVQAQTGSSANGTPSTFLTGAGGQDQLSQLARLNTFQLPPEQHKQLLVAAQTLQAQQLKAISTNATSLVLQSGVNTALQGVTVVASSTPASTTAKSSGQYVSQYPGDASILAQSTSQPIMMSLQPPQAIQNSTYYDPVSQGLGHIGGIPHSGGPGDHHPGHMTHSTRAHPQTIQWLLDNYETAEGVSLPRSTLYNHYLRHCAANKIDAVNAASFGKLIRSVFIGLKTRRLGTRGNSKYHYYGIRIKPDSPLNTFPTEETPVAVRQAPQPTPREYQAGEVPPEGAEATGAQPELTPQQQHQQYLGDARPELPMFPEIQWAGTPIPGAITIDEIADFTALYREHCEAILDVVVNLQFQMVENLFYHFWAESGKTTGDGQVDEDSDHQLTQEKLVLLTSCQPVVQYLSNCDHALYQCIVDFLISDVLRPIPGTLTQAIRNFAKSLEGWLTNSLQGLSANLTKSKISSVVAFSQTLRRYTSLNHLAQAARAVLQNSSQINQMLTDLNRVDFANVQEQASWVCECDESLVVQLEQDFKTTLQQQKSLEEWAAWLEGVVGTILEPFEGGPQFSKAARQFLLKWSFYSSMVIRDLTLRSAASFGSFHLIRLLYDEYMFFLIEHKVAKAAGKTPIAVMTEFSSQSRHLFSEGAGTPLSDTDAQDDDLAEPPMKRTKL